MNTQKLFLSHIKKLEELAMTCPWENKQFYADFLAQLYFYVQHTTRLIAFRASRISVDHREGHYEILQHLKEEFHHDKLLVNDLKALNRRISDFVEYPETSLIYQSQYYFIQNYPESSHLGFSLLIEGFAATSGPQIVMLLQKHYPSNACTFLHTHATVDQDHYRVGIEAMSKVPKEELVYINKNILQSFFLYSSMMKRVLEESKKNHSHKSAA